MDHARDRQVRAHRRRDATLVRMTASLQVQALGVSFSYRKPVLSDVDLTLRDGETALLLGQNGAGKSTLLRLLAGETRPDSGAVRICGRDPRRARTRARLFFLREEACPPQHLSALETIRYFRGLYGRERWSTAKCLEILERFGLAEVAKVRASAFSKGMQRRLELAALLAVDPDVWLLDEPQAGLDPGGLRILREVVREAPTRGRTLVMATHALTDVLSHAASLLVLTKGRVTFRGTSQDLLRSMTSRAYTVEGANDDFDALIRAFVASMGLSVSGPEIPMTALEEALFKEAAQ